MSDDLRQALRCCAVLLIASVVSFLLAIQSAERHAIRQEAYDSAYHNWEVARATVEGQLRSTFADPELASRWVALADAVTALYQLSGTWSEPYRSQVLDELRAFFSSAATEWDVLRQLEKKQKSNEDFQNYFAAWWKLREAALRKTADFGQVVVRSETR